MLSTNFLPAASPYTARASTLTTCFHFPFSIFNFPFSTFHEDFYRHPSLFALTA